MSAANVYIERDAVHLFTDGGAFGPDGQLTHRLQKVRIAAHQNAAFTARGPVTFSDILTFLVSQAQGDFDNLLDQFPGLCRKAHDATIQAAEAGKTMAADPRSTDAVLIGLSDRRGFVAFSFEAACQPYRLSWSPNELRSDSPLCLVTPGDPALESRMEAAGHSLWASGIDAEIHGLALMREQRSTTPIVDGFCQMTSVTCLGVRTRILERWEGEASGPRSLFDQPAADVGANQVVMQ